MTFLGSGDGAYCDACGGKTYRSARYVAARPRKRVWYAPWRFTPATPAVLKLTCSKCGKVHDQRPGTVELIDEGQRRAQA